VIVTPEELAALREHARAEYPRESCGVILVRGQERRLLPCRNIQDELHERDPGRHPRDARTAYYIDPQDLLRMGRLEGEGFAVAVIYHSHIDVGAYFSETDRRQALMEDEPSYPTAVYLVTAVRGTAAGPQVEATAGFAWDQARRDFTPVDLQVPVFQNGEGND
jgi:adenylyltransferase/sulfurtransferase